VSCVLEVSFLGLMFATESRQSNLVDGLERHKAPASGGRGFSLSDYQHPGTKKVELSHTKAEYGLSNLYAKLAVVRVCSILQ